MTTKKTATKWFSSKKEYFYTILFISAIFLGICFYKHIFPFGTGRIDTSDFEQESVPVYYHLWDVLHGNGNLFFTWNSGGGIGFAGVSSFFSLLSPFSLFFLFIKRSWIEPSMTFYILMKFIFMGITMCFFLKNFWKDKGFSLPSLWIIIGSVAYSLSAYSVQYYLFPWLDIAAAFPVLIYAFLKMIQYESTWRIGKYSISYLFLLSLIFLMHIPQAYMICLYLILLAGSCTYFCKQNSTNNCTASKGSVLKFGLLSLLALGLSFFLFLPGAISIMTSGRMSGSSDSLFYTYLQFLKGTGSDPSVKRIMLYSMFIPLLYLIVTWHKNCSKSHFLPECIMIVASILPVFFENINIIWLMGPYHGFPMRYGYMMIFTILAAAGNHMISYAPKRTADVSYAFLSSKKTLECMIAGIWLISILGLGIWLIRAGVSDEEGSFVQNAEEIQKILPSNTDVFHKTKLADASLNNNYPLITKSCSFSNYTHLVSQEQIDFNKALGYSQNWTRISDTGGTLFSDALLGYQTTFHTTLAGKQGWEYQSDIYDLYQFIEQSSRFASYANNYNYSPGLTVSQTALDAYHATTFKNPFELQNALANLFFDETMFTITEYEVFDEENIYFDVTGNGIVYLFSDDLKDAIISINGLDVPVPDFFYGITDNTFPSFYHKGILGLGCYSDEAVEINIRHQDWAENIQQSHITVAIMDLDRFKKTTEEKTADCQYTVTSTGLNISVTATEPCLLYLPLYIDQGWECKLNGKECSLQSLSNTYMMIPLNKGRNMVELTYQPIGMFTGITVSLLSLLILIGWCASSRLLPQCACIGKIYQCISVAAYFVFGFIFLFYMILVYIIPIIYTLIRAIP